MSVNKESTFFLNRWIATESVIVTGRRFHSWTTLMEKAFWRTLFPFRKKKHWKRLRQVSSILTNLVANFWRRSQCSSSCLRCASPGAQYKGMRAWGNSLAKYLSLRKKMLFLNSFAHFFKLTRREGLALWIPRRQIYFFTSVVLLWDRIPVTQRYYQKKFSCSEKNVRQTVNCSMFNPLT